MGIHTTQPNTHTRCFGSASDNENWDSEINICRARCSRCLVSTYCVPVRSIAYVRTGGLNAGIHMLRHTISPGSSNWLARPLPTAPPKELSQQTNGSRQKGREAGLCVVFTVQKLTFPKTKGRKRFKKNVPNARTGQNENDTT